LAEIQARIENRASYGEAATGRYLAEEFAKEPFGWDFDVVRLFVACLLRAGKIDATSQNKVIESAVSVDARTLFGNNNTFKSASFRPKVAIDFAKLVEANECFKEVFGHELPDIASQGAVATEIRKACLEPEETLSQAHTLLVSHQLPGAQVLLAGVDLLKSIRTSSEEQAILGFNAGYKQLKEARKRAGDLRDVLTEPALLSLRNARGVLSEEWRVLKEEPDLEASLREQAALLGDLLGKETFYRELSAISQHAVALKNEHGRRHSDASTQRATAYTDACTKLTTVPGWSGLSSDQQERLLAPLKACAAPASPGIGLALLRSDIDACPGRTQKVIEEMLRLIDGARLVRLEIGRFFSGGIETTEQLDAAIAALREECERQIAEGRRVLIQ
jgi:hypothetical protein